MPRPKPTPVALSGDTEIVMTLEYRVPPERANVGELLKTLNAEGKATLLNLKVAAKELKD